MNLVCWLEKFVDYGVLLLLTVGVSYWLPVFCALPIALAGLLFIFKMMGRTPGMLLTSKRLFAPPSVSLFFKLFVSSGKGQTIREKRNIFRMILGGGIVALCLVGIVFTSTLRDFPTSFEIHQKNAGWEYYISEARGFAVQLPANPVVETKQLYIEDADKTLNYSEYVSVEPSGASYAVSFMDFPSKWRFVGSKRLLSTAFEQLVKSDAGVEIVSQALVQHKMYPALEFTLKKGEDEMRGRLILVGNTFYKVTRLSSNASVDDEEQFAAFLGSFQFPKENK